MQRHIIYLIGQISSNPESYRWRKELQNILENDYPENVRDHISILDPCKNSMNLSLIRETPHNEQQFNQKAKSHVSYGILAPLDAGYVAQSTLCIANLNHFTPERPIIGTYFELAWYYHNYPHKPVVGIIDGNPSDFYHTSHPFVQAAVHVWVKNIKEAIQLIVTQCFC